MLLRKFPSEVDRMPYPDLVRLIAFFQLEPFPDPTRDAAQICAVLANCNRSPGGRPWRVADFLPRAPVGDRGQSTEDMQAMFDMIGGGG